MSVIQLIPGSSALYAKASVRPSVNYGQFTNPMGGLYPLRLAAFDTPEYRMMAGWPTNVPDYDIYCETLASCEGEVIGNRESPRAVITNALVRWIADSDTYDQTSLQWYPYQSSVDAQFVTAAEFAPTMLEDYEYRSGSERFYQDAINFDADGREHFWTDLTQSLGGAAGYSVLMCVNLHSVFGDSATAYAGLWGPGAPTPSGQDTFTENFDGWISVKLKGQTLYVGTEQTSDTKTLAIADLLERSAPFYLGFCFARPYATIWAGAGPSSMRSFTVFTGATPQVFSGRVALGRPQGTVLNSADMAVLDLGIYADKLSATAVKTEVAKLSAIYGGDK